MDRLLYCTPVRHREDNARIGVIVGTWPNPDVVSVHWTWNDTTEDVPTSALVVDTDPGPHYRDALATALEQARADLARVRAAAEADAETMRGLYDDVEQARDQTDALRAALLEVYRVLSGEEPADDALAALAEYTVDEARHARRLLEEARAENEVLAGLLGEAEAHDPDGPCLWCGSRALHARDCRLVAALSRRGGGS